MWQKRNSKQPKMLGLNPIYCVLWEPRIQQKPLELSPPFSLVLCSLNITAGPMWDPVSTQDHVIQLRKTSTDLKSEIRFPA